MKALQQIIRRVAENPSRPWALATLVQTEGSTYRKPGARLLVDSNGGTLGVLSGGCLEEEIARHGQKVIADASPVLLAFDTKRLYGCDGQLKILVEPVPAAGQNGNLITKIGRLLMNRELCRIRTCFEGDSIGSELLALDVFLAERRGILIDTVPLPVRLLLFGTGPEIEPITQLAGNLGWVVERFGHPSELEGDFRPDAQTAAVVATHNFGRDFATLQKLLSLNLRYAGLIGPRKRRDQLLNHLLDLGVTINPGFFSPAGLDLGAEAPEEIALTIVSEIQRVLAKGSGQSLRERKISIHTPQSVDSSKCPTSAR
jgi:xanthine/CO dehydrogenase XdhC/CoxF family maturation factor